MGKSNIPGYTRALIHPKQQEIKAKDSTSHMQETYDKKIKEMNDRMEALQADYAKMQNRVINVERDRTSQNNFPPKGNWVPKKGPPNQLDPINMVEEVIPYRKACEALHEESTCYMARQILEHGLPESNDIEQFASKPEYVNTVGQLHPVTAETWGQAKEYSQRLDNLTKNFGTKTSNEQIKEMPKFKGITYLRRDSLST